MSENYKFTIMKELSIEEKAKRYDSAIEKFNVILNLNTVKESGTIFADDVRKIFPELAESEDEKIRKYIIKVVHEWWVRCNDPSPDFPNEEKMLAYLEKQGEQKSILDVEIPFGAKDSELQEVSYYIPEGFHAEIESNRVIIKRGEPKPTE